MHRPRIYHSLLPWRRHLFVDCGGHDGCSIRRFMTEFDPKGRFDMVTFEPNEAFGRYYSDFPRHRLIQAAVYDRDQTLEFFLDREDGDGSTIFKDKLTAANGGYGSLDKEHPIRVKPIDLSEWLLQNTKPSDYVILKLDVEGAEYDILEKMFCDHSIDRVAHLFVEWHWSRVGVTNHRHAHVIQTLRQLHVHFADWDAQGY